MTEIVCFNTLLDEHIHYPDGLGYTKMVGLIYKVGKLKKAPAIQLNPQVNENIDTYSAFIDLFTEDQIKNIFTCWNKPEDLLDKILMEKRKRMSKAK